MQFFRGVGVLAALAVVVGCDAEEPRESVCGEAVEHVFVCLGQEAADVSCETEEDLTAAQSIVDASCEDLRGQERGLGDFECTSFLQWLGLCHAPDLACEESELGRAVADAIWRSDIDRGMVPRENLYGGRNAWSWPWVDAPEIFTGMADLIADAKYEVTLETFEWAPLSIVQGPGWDSDPTWVLVDGIKRLEANLKAAEAAGQHPHKPVRVHVALNGKSGGVAEEKAWHLAAQVQNSLVEADYVTVDIAVHQFDVWGAVHSKALVVDGYRAVVMGANPQPFNVFGSHWHDVGYKVEGEIGVSLRRSFDSTWERSEVVGRYIGAAPDGRLANGYHCDWTDTASGYHCSLSSTRDIDPPPEVEDPDLDAAPELAGACTPMAAAHRLPYSLTWGPLALASTSNPQNAAFSALMENAERVIKIETPNFNAGKAKDLVLDAVRRGVEVRMILSLGFNAWSERAEECVLGVCVGAGGANVDTVEDLYTELGDPALCDRLQIRWNAHSDGEPTWAQEPGASHTKYLTADGTVAMVGSANQDTVSWNLIQESNIVVDSRAATGAYDARVFDRDWYRAADVRKWARGLRDGTVPITPDLDALLYGDAAGWADRILTACGEGP